LPTIRASKVAEVKGLSWAKSDMYVPYPSGKAVGAWEAYRDS
jgi:hypothetical protein